MKKPWIWIVLFLFVTSVYAASDNKQVQKGKEAFGKREYAKSITIFKKLIESDPEQGDYFVFLGAAYCKNGQFKEAVDACQKSLNLPHAKEWENLSWTILAEANEELGRFDAAISSKKKSIELDPNSSDNFAGLSKLYNDNQQNDEAITAAKRAIELRPDAWFAFYNLGVAYGRKEQYAEAIEALKKAIEIEPKEIRVYAAMAFFFAEQGDYAEAIEVYKKAIEAQPSARGFHDNLAIAYFHTGNYDEAIAAANRALELEPLTGSGPQQQYKDKTIATTCIALKSLSHRYKGNQGESFQDAEKAYSLDPADGLARRSRGAAYLDRGQYDEAIKLLSQDKGENEQILEATAYAKQGKMKEAVDIYVSILEGQISPRIVPLMYDRLALLQLFTPLVREHRDKASSFETRGLHKEALSELSEALKVADEAEGHAIRESIFSMLRSTPSLAEMPEEAREHALRGEMLVKEGSFEKAAEEFKQAIRIAPYAARLYYNSALIHAELKKYSEAVRQMGIYLQAAPDAPDARAAKDEIIKWKFLMEKEK